MITPHQRSVLAYIRQFQQERRYSPSLSILALRFNVRSKTSIAKVIHTLHMEGFLDLDPKGGICFPKGTFVPQPL